MNEVSQMFSDEENALFSARELNALAYSTNVARDLEELRRWADAYRKTKAEGIAKRYEETLSGIKFIYDACLKGIQILPQHNNIEEWRECCKLIETELPNKGLERLA